jgi:CRP/FNR family cyclic AMP-dependent transcriptional regulator
VGRGERQAQPEKSSMIPTCGAAFDPVGFLTQDGPGKTRLSYRKGNTIFLQNDLANSVFYIQRGIVKKSYVSTHGKERVVAILRGGDFFGIGCVISRTKHTTTATAMTACSVTRIEKGVMLHLLYSEPAFAEIFISFLIASRSHYQNELIDQLINSSEKRLARTLLLLCDMGEKDGEKVVLPKISQEVLGQLVGTTRSRINHFLGKFRERGIIEQDGEIRVYRSLLNSYIGERPEE